MRDRFARRTTARAACDSKPAKLRAPGAAVVPMLDAPAPPLDQPPEPDRDARVHAAAGLLGPTRAPARSVSRRGRAARAGSASCRGPSSAGAGRHEEAILEARPEPSAARRARREPAERARVDRGVVERERRQHPLAQHVFVRRARRACERIAEQAEPDARVAKPAAGDPHPPHRPLELRASQPLVRVSNAREAEEEAISRQPSPRGTFARPGPVRREVAKRGIRADARVREVPRQAVVEGDGTVEDERGEDDSGEDLRSSRSRRTCRSRPRGRPAALRRTPPASLRRAPRRRPRDRPAAARRPP